MLINSNNLAKKKYLIDKLFVFVIYGIFLMMSLLLVLIGIHIYRNIVYKAEINTGVRVSMYYVANKIRAGASDGFRHEIIEDTEVLIFSEGNFQTLVYYKDGFIWELVKFAHEPFIWELGEKIIASDGFTITEENGVYAITSAASDGIVHTMYLYSGGLH